MSLPSLNDIAGSGNEYQELVAVLEMSRSVPVMDHTLPTCFGVVSVTSSPSPSWRQEEVTTPLPRGDDTVTTPHQRIVTVYLSIWQGVTSAVTMVTTPMGCSLFLSAMDGMNHTLPPTILSIFIESIKR